MQKIFPDEAVYNDSMSRSGRSVRHKAEKIDSFEDRLDSLFEELAFAVRNDRPSILFLPYASEYNRADVELALEKRLAGIDQQLVQFMVDEKQFDLPLLLSRRPDRNKSVYSIPLFPRAAERTAPMLTSPSISAANCWWIITSGPFSG